MNIKYHPMRNTLQVENVTIRHGSDNGNFSVCLFYHYPNGIADAYFLGLSFKNRYISFVCPWGMGCLNKHGLTITAFGPDGETTNIL